MEKLLLLLVPVRFEQEEEEEEYYDDDDDTKFVNSRLTVFSCGELKAGMNLLGICRPVYAGGFEGVRTNPLFWLGIRTICVIDSRSTTGLV